MGGHKHGELASKVAVDYVSGKLSDLIWQIPPLDPEQLKQQLTMIVEKANIKVYLSAISDQDCLGMGTTLTVAVLIPDRAVLAHVGDCRAYLLRQGELQRLTVDHTLVQELVDAGSISLDESLQHPRRNVLTKALGIPDLLTPDTLSIALTSGDRLLLCSDGLHSLVTEDVIREQLSQETTAAEVADELVRLALELGGEDNITVLTAFV
jgi:protein phosphatase